MAKKPAKKRIRTYERTADQPVAITPIEYSGLQEAFDHFNAALFGSKLPDVFITYQRKAHSHGYFSPDRFTAHLLYGALAVNLVGGPALADVLGRYTGYSGRAPLPPAWAFGPWMSSDQWRDGGEYHLFNPQTIHKLQHAARTGSYKVFKEYSKLMDNQTKS